MMRRCEHETIQSGRGRLLLKPKRTASNVSGHVRFRNSTGLFGCEYALYVMVKRLKHCRFGDRGAALRLAPLPLPPRPACGVATSFARAERGGVRGTLRRGRVGFTNTQPAPPRGDSPSPGIRANRAHSGLSPQAGGGEKTPQNLDGPPLPPYTSARSLQGQRISPRGASNGGRTRWGLEPRILTCLAAAN
jgi:hypothetical protein